MKQAAIYARVSTWGQEPKTQLRELRSYFKRRNLRVAYELVDHESGAKETRPKLDKLLDLTRKRNVDVVLVWKFDRFARSTKQLVTALEEFRELGVDFISYTENVDTSTHLGTTRRELVSPPLARGFELHGYLFVNDPTSGDGRRGEAITFGWRTRRQGVVPTAIMG